MLKAFMTFISVTILTALMLSQIQTASAKPGKDNGKPVTKPISRSK